MFISRLAEEGLAHQSIKVYLSAVRNLHVASGLHEEFSKQLTPKLEMVLRGIKKETAKSKSPRIRLPITIEVMEKIKEVLQRNPTSEDSILHWAACGLAFFGFLRCSEFTLPSQSEYDASCHLSVDDIAIDSADSPSLVQVTIKQSKTDPFRKGVKLFLAKTGKEICPVTAILPYMALRGPKKGPLFVFKDGCFLTRQRFSTLLRTTLQQAGLDDSKYATHSFRIGTATTAKDTGVSDVHIKMLGRWKSNAYQLYVRTPPEELASLSKQLVSKIK